MILREVNLVLVLVKPVKNYFLNNHFERDQKVVFFNDDYCVKSVIKSRFERCCFLRLTEDNG